MALRPSLNLKQKQRLAVTQKMQQSVAILAMSNAQLTNFLRNESTENPLIDLTEPSALLSAGGGSASVHGGVENTLIEQETLGAALLRQLHFCGHAEHIKHAALRIIENLDEKGLLDVSLLEISLETKVPMLNLEAGLKVVQGFEPSGVGARSLIECIALQLKSGGFWNSDFSKLLKLLPTGKNESADLAHKLNLTVTEIAAMMQQIQTLSLDPAQHLQTEYAPHVTPDVLFQTADTGDLEVVLNEAAFPKLSIDSAYFNASFSEDVSVIAYLNDRLLRVNWLRRALEKRASTILRISIALAKNQTLFFTHGASKIAPLTLKEVAENIQVHESTVSRAISGKYFSCDLGVYPFSFLFSTGLVNNAGSMIAAEAIRAEILSLITAETPDNILSDTKVADLLDKQGIKVARRTIAKYRGVMNIPTSSIRKIQKRHK